jgi:hypothetical protein
MTFEISSLEWYAFTICLGQNCQQASLSAGSWPHAARLLPRPTVPTLPMTSVAWSRLDPGEGDLLFVA